jgi:hypothetical protein
MTLLQIQRKVKALPRSERLALSAYLKHLSWAESESNKRSLDAAAGRIAKGEKVTRAQLQRLHKSLRAVGSHRRGFAPELCGVMTGPTDLSLREGLDADQFHSSRSRQTGSSRR